MPIEQAGEIGKMLIDAIQEIAKEGTKGGSLLDSWLLKQDTVNQLEVGNEVQLPFGLRGYPDLVLKRLFNRPSAVDDEWETRITQRLAARLARAIGVEGEVRYPKSDPNCNKKPRCDLVIPMNEEGPIWVECKSIFECVLPKDTSFPLGRDYSGKDCTQASTKNSLQGVENDALRLGKLTRADAAYIGLLVLGFDREDGTQIQDAATFKALAARLKMENWLCISRAWDDFYSPRAVIGFREHCWFWYRAVTN